MEETRGLTKDGIPALANFANELKGKMQCSDNSPPKRTGLHVDDVHHVPLRDRVAALERVFQVSDESGAWCMDEGGSPSRVAALLPRIAALEAWAPRIGLGSAEATPQKGAKDRVTALEALFEAERRRIGNGRHGETSSTSNEDGFVCSLIAMAAQR